jgi:preprotein translocase subunit SecG
MWLFTLYPIFLGEIEKKGGKKERKGRGATQAEHKAGRDSAVTRPVVFLVVFVFLCFLLLSFFHHSSTYRHSIEQNV